MSNPDISSIVDKLGPPDMKAGWLREEEDEAWYESLPEVPDMGDFMPVRALPFYKNPKEWLRIENQNGFGSCQGHALSTCMEICYFYQTGEEIQLSRWYAYVKSQIYDGIRSDRGSTIRSGAKVATEDGLPLEELMPYPRRYSQNIPREADEAAGEHKLKTAYRIETWKKAQESLDAGVGAINIGIPWGGGGHAIALIDADGTFANSHGTRYGDRGFGQFSGREWEKLFRHSFTKAYMLSDMEKAEPREVQWNERGQGMML